MRFLGLSIFVLLGALLSAAPIRAGATETGAGSSAPVSKTKQSDRGNEVSDPITLRSEDIWHTYQIATFKSLSASSEPRDRALAALTNPLNPFAFDEASQHERATLIDRAALDAPDDSLVQWIALLHSHEPTSLGTTNDAPLQALLRIEPDNAAVWVEVLIRASQQKDSTATDTALARMAASTRFDEHYLDVQKALVNIYTRYPVPDEYISSAAAEISAPEETIQSKESMPYFTATAIAAAIALPAYQPLIKACTINSTTNENNSRASACAAIGHLMVSRGKTLLANRVGYSVLRVSGTFNDDDIQHARIDDWIYQQRITQLRQSGEHPVQEVITNINDLIETGSELEAMRRAIARAGIQLMPSPDWADMQTPFSAERLRNDQLAADRAASAPAH